LGEIGVDNRQLGLLFGHQIFAATFSELLNRVTSPLGLTGQRRDCLLIGQVFALVEPGVFQYGLEAPKYSETILLTGLQSLNHVLIYFIEKRH
jgi:hypothetical protein